VPGERERRLTATGASRARVYSSPHRTDDAPELPTERIVLRIVPYSHPALRYKSRPVATIDDALRGTVRAMFDLMYAAKGIGLAANQVGLPFRLFVLNLSADPEKPEEEQVFLNPEARVMVDKKSSDLAYPSKVQKKPQSQSTTDMVENLMKVNASSNSNPGVDIESVDAIDIYNDTFVERNFTQVEIDYCRQAPNPQASFTGKWSAKEAVFKSLKVEGKGAGAALKDIEIRNDESGAPVVTLYGDAKAAADKAGVKSTTVSISHSDAQVIAVAISSF